MRHVTITDLARRLNLSAAAQRRINYAMAASMLVVVVLAVFAAL